MDRRSGLCSMMMLGSCAAHAHDSAWIKKRIPASDPATQGAVPDTNGKSLEEVYRAALARAYTVNIQDELLVQAHELDVQAKGALLPTIGGSATFLDQQTPSSSVGSSISPLPLQSTIKITADQPDLPGLPRLRGAPAAEPQPRLLPLRACRTPPASFSTIPRKLTTPSWR